MYSMLILTSFFQNLVDLQTTVQCCNFESDMASPMTTFPLMFLLHFADGFTDFYTVQSVTCKRGCKFQLEINVCLERFNMYSNQSLLISVWH